MTWLPAVLVGAAAGVLSACGIGGGTLLLLYLTAVAALPQALAQGINLLYFLPTAGIALPAHFKNGFLDRSAALPAIAAGLLATGLSAWAATGLDTALLRRCFGGFLLLIGLSELLRKSSRA